MITDLEELRVMLSFVAIISSLFGVFIGTLITAYFAERREKKKLIKDLQIKATEDLLKDIKKVIDNLTKYDSFVSNLKLRLDNNIIKISPIDENIFESLMLLHQQFHESYSNFMNNFDSKRVIFNKFWGMRNYFYDTNKDFFNIYTELANLLSGIYYVKILNNMLLDDKEFKKLVYLCNSCDEKYYDLVSYLYDFQVELQNEFLSKLFKCKVPRRVVLDKDLKVLTTDLKYECKGYENYQEAKKE